MIENFTQSNENDFVNFLQNNLNNSFSNEESTKYIEGISGINFLESIDKNLVNIEKLIYFKNLSLKDPESFIVPDNLFILEKVLYYSSFNDFKSAIDLLNKEFNLKFEVIGSDAISRGGNKYVETVLKISGTANREEIEYIQKYSTFEKFKVSKLNLYEIIYLYIKLKEIVYKEENRELLLMYVEAYFHRAIFAIENLDITNNFINSNELNNDGIEYIKNMLELSFRLIYSKVTEKSNKLEKFVDFQYKIDNLIFNIPICFKCDVLITLGNCFIKEYDYSGAYKLFENYIVRDERIKCLMAMKEFEKCVKEIEEYILSILSKNNIEINNCVNIYDILINENLIKLLKRTDKMKISNLFIKLGHIYQNPEYYDKAALIFPSDAPFRAKGLFYFNQKNYELAVIAMEQALKLIPENEELLYTYGSTLIELNRIAEATKIFKKLKIQNQQSVNIAKGLSFCYYKMEDLESSLYTLKSVARNDQSSLKQYLFISIKNSLKENILWALQFVTWDSVMSESCNYILYNNILTKEELYLVLTKNVYIDQNIIQNILK